MPFEFKRLGIPEVILITPRVFNDERGFFKELYKVSDFSSFGIRKIFIQDNLSFSKYGVLRGLHYQIEPKAQGKLVSCLKGIVFDVAVDIRRGSPTYGKWVGIELSAKNHQMLYIPPGFAHGFVVLSDEALVLYKCTQEYAPEAEAGIIWNDPAISIRWPIQNPLLSPRDKKWPTLNEANNNFVYQG